ncbi:MAG: hypothetical protein GX485_09260 [Clostridiales bacterium]|nr:hypothetical protein [Clostridiales bacterium]
MADVNAAQTSAEMQTAINDPSLGLNLTKFNMLIPSLQNDVLAGLLRNRPTLGYVTMPDLQDMLDYEVTMVQTEVYLDNIFVQSGATGGNGSLTKPFGTIPDGISAVNPGGTVHILAGEYPISENIVVNKNGITLSGEPGNRLVQIKESVTPLFISGSNVTIQNLNVTSDKDYLGALIEVAGDNVTLRNNQIYGLTNSGAVNRGILLGTKVGIVVENNHIHSLSQGIGISSGAVGNVNNNHIEGTQTGIFVSSGSMSIMGNYWSGIKNGVCDIGLMSNIAQYYDTDQLSIDNNTAFVRVF